MNAHIVILGGGTGGTLAANRLRRELADATITVVDENDLHVYQPGLLFVPFGLAQTDEIVRPRRQQLRRGINFVSSVVDRVDLEAQRVELRDGTALMLLCRVKSSRDEREVFLSRRGG